MSCESVTLPVAKRRDSGANRDRTGDLLLAKRDGKTPESPLLSDVYAGWRAPEVAADTAVLVAIRRDLGSRIGLLPIREGAILAA